MALSDRLINNAIARLPSASEPVIRAEVWNVVDKFCRESWAWRETIEVPLVALQQSYEPTPPGTEIIHVFNVSHETMDVKGTVYELGVITLPAAPVTVDPAKPLFVVAALTPAIDAGADVENLIPQDMWSAHHQVLLSGLLATMMGHPAKPYSNPNMALFYLRDFRAETTNARQRARLGMTIGAQQWRFPSWA